MSKKCQARTEDAGRRCLAVSLAAWLAWRETRSAGGKTGQLMVKQTCVCHVPFNLTVGVIDSKMKRASLRRKSLLVCLWITFAGILYHSIQCLHAQRSLPVELHPQSQSQSWPPPSPSYSQSLLFSALRFFASGRHSIP